MQLLTEHNVEWAAQPWGRVATVAPGATWQEVSPQQQLPAEKLSSGQELITVILAGGAQVRVDTRVFRPLAGQVLQRNAGEELEVVNDTTLPIRLMRVQLPANA